ncbi:hypothetical protein HPB52_022633 [Rhipicephalus sanguineus]|uniref:Tick transposon n=1 Tax=Rhipicephalus sanguineus TaxID=34632 RepID=A0A9D4Q8V5_RHISA|nr:hypothetical protein HPB52_022633 [Rhipicephalus sanguineus]
MCLRCALRLGADAAEVQDLWARYLRAKNSMSTLVQDRMRTINSKILKEIKEAGRDAGKKFWRHIQGQKSTAQPCTDSLQDPEMGLEYREHMAGKLRSQAGHSIGLDKRPQSPDLAQCDGITERELDRALKRLSAGQRHKVRERVRAAELERWRTSAQTKSALSVYRANKQAIEPERFFDNSRGSSLLSEARGGVLRTRSLQAKYTPSTSTTCHRCSAAEETIKHVVLECTGLQPGLPREQTNPSCPNALATALGFHEQGAPPNCKEVELTKRRLEHWWRTRNPPAPPKSADK